MYLYKPCYKYGKQNLFYLREKNQHELDVGQTARKIQPNPESEKIPQLTVGPFSFGQKSTGLRQVH